MKPSITRTAELSSSVCSTGPLGEQAETSLCECLSHKPTAAMQVRKGIIVHQVTARRLAQKQPCGPHVTVGYDPQLASKQAT